LNCSIVLDKPQQVEQVLLLVSQLPEENQIILQYLASFLARVNSNSEVNKMGISQIATW
jgi:hypothetical protein